MQLLPVQFVQSGVHISLLQNVTNKLANSDPCFFITQKLRNSTRAIHPHVHTVCALFRKVLVRGMALLKKLQRSLSLCLISFLTDASFFFLKKLASYREAPQENDANLENSDLQFIHKESGNSMTTQLQSARLLPHGHRSIYRH